MEYKCGCIPGFRRCPMSRSSDHKMGKLVRVYPLDGFMPYTGWDGGKRQVR